MGRSENGTSTDRTKEEDEEEEKEEEEEEEGLKKKNHDEGFPSPLTPADQRDVRITVG